MDGWKKIISYQHIKIMNNKHKRFRYNRTVIFEKFSKKDYIKNADDFLKRLGIVIYFESSSSINMSGYQKTLQHFSDKDYRKDVLNTYGIEELYNFFKTFTSNPKLKHLKHNPFLNKKHSYKELKFSGHIKSTDFHHKEYARSIIIDYRGNNRSFQIYSNSERALNKAGFLCNPEKVFSI
jgi:hypothetical protein